MNNSTLSSPFHRRPRATRGQALILIAMAFIGLLAFVGLAIDAGQFFIGMGNLRRATDAASLAGAAQVREGNSFTDVVARNRILASARQVLRLNGIESATAEVRACVPSEPAFHDATLCTTPPRKLVRVTAFSEVPMAFLTVIGINTIAIHADSVAEAASMDVTMVIDVSESMTYDASCSDGDDDDGDGVVDDCGGSTNGAFPDDYYRDPSACNGDDACHPFEEVKAAALNFIDRIIDLPPGEEQDRLGLVFFSNGWESDTANFKGTGLVNPGWINTNADAHNHVSNMRVYSPSVCPGGLGGPPGPCRNYEYPGGPYVGFECPEFRDTGDPSSCTTTNIGGGLRLGAQLFNFQPKDDALWIIVLLTDGAANASDEDTGFPYGYCPGSAGAPDWVNPFCRDNLVRTRHNTSSGLYDADDYARDMADFSACSPVSPAAGCNSAGQGAVVFSVGLGGQVLSVDSEGRPYGASLLRYVAAVGDDGDPATDLCASVGDPRAWCGNYYFSPTGSQLDRVFEDIASRIFTRIAQ